MIMNRKELIQRYINEPFFSDKLIRLGYKEAVEKACQWLKDELYDIEDNTQRGGFDIRSKCYFTSEDLIEHFKKEMEVIV